MSHSFRPGYSHPAQPPQGGPYCMNCGHKRDHANHKTAARSKRSPPGSALLIRGVWLQTRESRIRVLVETAMGWQVAIDVDGADPQTHVSHIVEPAGIRQAPVEKP